MMGIDLTRCYHELISREFKLATSNIVEKEGYMHGTILSPNKINVLSKNDIVKLFDKLNGGYGEKCFNELSNMGFIVKLGDNKFRSLHMDVALRSAFLRTAYDYVPYLVSPRIGLYRFSVPSKSDRIIIVGKRKYPHENFEIIANFLNNSIDAFFGNENGAKLYKEFLMEHFKNGGLDAFQAWALATLLRDNNKIRQSHILTAPTGAGKTEIFVLYTIAKMVRSKFNNTNENAVLVYPRKALAIDQTSRLILLIRELNKVAEKHNITLTVGIRDGETPKWKKGGYVISKNNKDHIVEDGESFKGMVGLNEKPFLYRIKDSKLKVEYDGDILEFIRVTRKDMYTSPPDILVTNMWTLERRLLDDINKKDINVGYFSNTGLLVVDETHEYTGLSGGMVSSLLNVVFKVSEISDFEIILASATLPHSEKFGEKFLPKKSSVNRIDFFEITNKLKNDLGVEFTGERLVLMGIYDLMPKYSWSSYVQLWSTYMAFLQFAYTHDKKPYKPKTLVFIENIKEIRRARRGVEEGVSLGEPKDHLIKPPTDLYSYAHYSDDHKFINHIYNKIVNRKEPLVEINRRVYEMHSLLPPKDRKEVIEKLKKEDSDMAVVLTTSSLELGVDYGGVSFILNVGFENPLSLRQRIGRGGRSAKSLHTVLGIILTKKVPTESFLLHDPLVWDKLHPVRSIDSEEMELIVSRNNPQIIIRERLTYNIVKLGLKGEPTYSSGRPIRTKEELIEFLKKIKEVDA